MLYLRGEVFIRAALVKVKLNPILTHPPRDLSKFHLSRQFQPNDWLSQGFQTYFFHSYTGERHCDWLFNP